MQRDYVAKGWIGLILGTRMWYVLIPFRNAPTVPKCCNLRRNQNAQLV